MLALLGALSIAPAAHARDAVVRSFDGTPIVTHFFPAEGLAAGKRAPTVLAGHGYGMSGQTNQDASSDGIFGQTGVGPIRRAGYNVLTWDARGFGGSGGQVEIDSKDFEGRDVQALIDFVARQPEAQLDRRNDPRLGMSGPSYGGAIQLVTAGIDRRVDAITPTIAWNSLLTALYKEGSVKQGWGSLLGAAGQTAVTGGVTSPAGPQTGGLNPQVNQALIEGAATGRFSDQSVAFFRSRATGPLVEKIRVPTLLLQGSADTVFPLSEAMRNHAILKRNGVPVKMIWFCGGHGVCLGGDGPGTVLEKAVVNWFDRYLKRRAVKTGPPFQFFPDAGRLTAGTTFPPVRTGSISATGSGTLAIAPSADAGGGALIVSSPNATAFNVDLPPARAASDVLGEPRLRFTYSGTGAPAQTHVYAQIVDTARNLVLGNVSTPVPVTLDGKTRTIERPLEPVVARAVAGKRYRLQIAAASTLYTPQRSSGVVNFAKVAITLPLVNAKASPAFRLRVGPTRGMRRARRGRPFKIRVRAVGDTLTGVRLIVRDRLNRQIGSSARFMLKARTRKPRVRVRRRLGPGRYRIIATGENAEGITVRTIKRVRIKKRR